MFWFNKPIIKQLIYYDYIPMDSVESAIVVSISGFILWTLLSKTRSSNSWYGKIKLKLDSWQYIHCWTSINMRFCYPYNNNIKLVFSFNDFILEMNTSTAVAWVRYKVTIIIRPLDFACLLLSAARAGNRGGEGYIFLLNNK